jgi:Flp pilus assembly protein TadG
MARIIRNSRSRLATFGNNSSGSAIIEFALLAPAFLIMFIGVFQVAVYLQNYNAVQSLASDGSRYVMVEYQKNNTLADEQIESVLLGEAVNAPYMLDTDRLSVEVDRSGVSRIDGAVEIEILLTYQLSDFLPGITLPLSTITYSRPVFVVTS